MEQNKKLSLPALLFKKISEPDAVHKASQIGFLHN